MKQGRLVFGRAIRRGPEKGRGRLALFGETAFGEDVIRGARNLMGGVVLSTDRAFGRGAIKHSRSQRDSSVGVQSMRRDDSNLFSEVQPKLMADAEQPFGGARLGTR